VCLHVPAVVTSEVAVLGRLTEVGIADAEANLRDMVAWVLVTGVGREMRDSVSRHAPITVEKAFKVVSGAVELDPVDRVGVFPHDTVVVGGLWINVEVEVLVEVDVAWGDVVEHGRVPLAIPQPALVRVVAGTRHERVVSVVLDLERELNGFTVVSHPVIPEGFHGHAAEEVGQRGDCVGETAQGGCRLNGIID
jgi:hypothetical protein